MTPDSSETDRVQELGDQAFDALDQGDIETAIANAKELRKLSHSSAFEIEALALASRGDLEGALATLEEGVDRAPDVWILWQLLGNYRSDIDDFAGAFAAYERALACPDTDASSVNYNHGLALLRDARPAEALERLDLVVEGDVELLAISCRMQALNELTRHDEAFEIGTRALEQIDEQEQAEAAARVLAELGTTLWKRDGHSYAAIEHAREAIQIFKHTDTAQWLLRELEGQISPAARHFRLMVHGNWSEPSVEGEPVSFFTTYQVVANTPAQAFDLVRPFEPESATDLELEECEDLAPAPDAPSGVYETGPYHFYARDEE